MAEETGSGGRTGRLRGFFAAGPMKAVCLEDAPTREDAERVLSEHGTVIDLWELVEGEDNPLGGPAVCVVCGKTVLEER